MSKTNTKKELILLWMRHIQQIATDRKTLNGEVMEPMQALGEIKALAKNSAEFIEKFWNDEDAWVDEDKPVTPDNPKEFAIATAIDKEDLYNEAYSNGVSDGIKEGYNSAVEKACEWLMNHGNDYIINDRYPLPNGEMSRDWLKIKSEMFGDFKKAMKQ